MADPAGVLHWKIVPVVLRVKEKLRCAQPYVAEYAAAFEAAGADVSQPRQLRATIHPRQGPRERELKQTPSND